MKTKTKSKKVNKNWLHDHINDPYVKAAQKDGYRARAAYKLKEIDESLKLIQPGHTVVDLGCAPGAWSQYVRRRLSPSGAAVGELNGRIISLDLLPMEPIEGVHYIQGDFVKRRCWRSWKRPWAAARPTWWSRTWRPICRAWRHGRGAGCGADRDGGRFCDQQHEARGRAGGQAFPRQRL
jgi:hypothetical protein